MTEPLTPDEHRGLWRRDPRATPFQSPAWLDAWWDHLGGGERHDFCVRLADGRPIAALPMFVWHDEGVRRLVPVGAGHSDYCDALADPDQAGAAIAGLWRAIGAIADRWDEVILPDLRADTPLLGALPEGWQADDVPADTCPVMALDGADVLAGLTKGQRRKIVHDRHRAAALGNVTVALAGNDEIDEALDSLFALHAARWEAAGQAGVFADPRVRAFHRAAAPALAREGLLRLAVVRHGGRIVSVLLGFANERSGYSYAIGSDFGVAKQSFGTLAFAHLIEGVAAAGATRFDFLRGEETYKFGWGAVRTHTVRRTIRRTN